MPSLPSPPIFPSCAAPRIRGSSSPRPPCLDYAAIGIADRNSLAGVVRAYEEWEKQDADSARHACWSARGWCFSDGTPDILAYPRDRAAYGRSVPAAQPGQIARAQGRLLSHSVGPAGSPYREGLLLIVMPPADPDGIKPVLARLGPDTWLAASMLYTGEDRRRLRDLKRLARDARVPLIAVNDALYHHADQRAIAGRRHLHPRACHPGSRPAKGCKPMPNAT